MSQPTIFLDTIKNVVKAELEKNPAGITEARVRQIFQEELAAALGVKTKKCGRAPHPGRCGKRCFGEAE